MADFNESLRECRELILAQDHPQPEWWRPGLELEQALSEMSFRGLPVSATLTDLLSAILIRRQVSRGLRPFLKAWVRRLYHRMRGVGRAVTEAEILRQGRGKVLIGQITNRPHAAQWAPDLVRLLGASSCHVMTDNRMVVDGLADDTTSSSWGALPTLPHAAWRRDYRRCRRVWTRHLSSFAMHHGLSRADVLTFEDTLFVTTQRCVQMGAYLDLTKPCAVLVDYDRNVRASSLVLAARARNIPTLTLVHGVINSPFGYTPFLAHHVLCWGAAQRRQIEALATPAERIREVGYHLMDGEITADRDSVRRSAGVGHDEPVVLLATNPVCGSDRQRLAEVFCEAVRRIPRAHAFLRVHPSEKTTDYDFIDRSRYDLTCVSDAELSADESLALSDAVVVHSSGFGTEAMAKRRPCVVLDAIDSPLGNGRVLAEKAGVPRVESAEELAGVLTRCFDNGAYRDDLIRRGRAHAHEVFGVFRPETTRNIARAVLDACQGGNGGSPHSVAHPSSRQTGQVK